MNQSATPFAGFERRQHAVFVTRNSEYHVRRGRVVAVRRRGESRWSAHHAALRMRLDGHVGPQGNAPAPGAPVLGERLFLVGDHDSMVTSSVVALERPTRETVSEYPSAQTEAE